jgi:hypothetical protein
MSYEIKLIKPFGPAVLKVKIPEKILNDINKYIDDVVKDNKKSNELNHGQRLAGDVTQEFKLDQDFSKKVGWLDFLVGCTSKWIELTVGRKISKFQVENSWVVRQFENEYNPTHWHSGHISGAGFLKVPSSLGKNIQEKKKNPYKGGNLQLIHGSRMFLSQSTMNILPKVGDFYFFPHYLMHQVFPFKDSKEERRSISFNAMIDDNIYDVYGGD